jgi:hemerythrin-like domain-containing protein
MLRDPNLIPLSRQHQHALALCVRIRRAKLASTREARAWQAEIEQHFEIEIRHHFAAEEAFVFPSAKQITDLAPLVEELLTEHAQLRANFEAAKARTLDGPAVRQFAEALSDHIRKEERLLFEKMQQELPAPEMERIGNQIARAMASVPELCIPPTEQVLKKIDD